MNNIGSAQQVLVAISDALHLVNAYSSDTGKVEVERLYSIGTDFSSFLTALRTTNAFHNETAIRQQDTFFDLRSGERWMLSAIDHYVRLREERTETGLFIRGEIKKAYPGPRWNLNARPARDCSLTEEELLTWRKLLGLLGLEEEREYVKFRVSCSSIAMFHDTAIELEIDRFAGEGCNGVLRDRTFISTSVETAGATQSMAELALTEGLSVLHALGIPLVACDGCYEDYFYGKLQLPSMDPSITL